MIASHSDQITRAWYEALMLLHQTHYPGWYTKVMVSWLNISTKNAGAPVNPREAKSSTKTSNQVNIVGFLIVCHFIVCFF